MVIAFVALSIQKLLTLVFRYFSIAHEIAHNLVLPHNSDHEYYFSEICEHFMMDLTRLLTGGAR
jgi:hypothetical protein